jgi:PPOX class probable F420-dependent enzyme
VPHLQGTQSRRLERLSAVSVTFDEATRSLLDGKNFATLATLNPDGAPQTSVVWFKRAGDTIELTTNNRRQKARNVSRDPRVSLSVFAIDDPYSSVEVRGTAELIEDPTRALSLELSHKYLDEDPPPEDDDVVRYIVRITPTKVIGFSA